ncbi:MAG: hypothetical protein KBA70_12265 [Aquabacterium sp.]|uniref:hypothetical protein n=1 Tax=Aquabacterium sp. TaxID=1872578 RepID=UPI001B3D21CD|nr:hypothetical protein [Aquabacterium sp.]MBP7133519.1 hypothetical protein [Aquabacterium sp.]
MLPFSYGSYVNYTGPALTTKDLKTGLFSLGYSYDAGNWLAQAEFITPRGGGVTIADSNAGYVMAGYRFGKFTPYAVYAESVTKETRSSQPRAVNHSTIPQLDLVAYGINAVNDKFNSLQNQKTISLGARYDVAKNIALKMQLDHIKKPGSLTTPNVGWFAVPIPVYPNTLPDAATKDISANLLTLTLDFVF